MFKFIKDALKIAVGFAVGRAIIAGFKRVIPFMTSAYAFSWGFGYEPYRYIQYCIDWVKYGYAHVKIYTGDLVAFMSGWGSKIDKGLTETLPFAPDAIYIGLATLFAMRLSRLLFGKKEKQEAPQITQTPEYYQHSPSHYYHTPRGLDCFEKYGDSQLQSSREQAKAEYIEWMTEYGKKNNIRFH